MRIERQEKKIHDYNNLNYEIQKVWEGQRMIMCKIHGRIIADIGLSFKNRFIAKAYLLETAIF